jgi:hypothetical protein
MRTTTVVVVLSGPALVSEHAPELDPGGVSSPDGRRAFEARRQQQAPKPGAS